MTTAVQTRRYTYADYLMTPDDERYELIEGDLLMSPSPVPYHQRISRELEFALHSFVKQHDLGEVFDAPCDVHLDDENVFEPDILFIARARLAIIGEKNIQGAPDLVIEILSESTAHRDMVRKKRLYARFGVKEYWIADPLEKTIEIFVPKEGEGRGFELWREFALNERLTSPLLPGFQIALAEVFSQPVK